MTFEGVGSCTELPPPRTVALVALLMLLLLHRIDQLELSRTGHHTDPVCIVDVTIMQIVTNMMMIMVLSIWIFIFYH